MGYYFRNALGGLKSYAKGTVGKAIETSADLDAALEGKKSWETWKKISTFISYLAAIAMFAISIEEDYSRNHDILKSVFQLNTFGILLIAVAVFYIVRYFLKYAMVWIPFLLILVLFNILAEATK